MDHSVAGARGVVVVTGAGGFVGKYLTSALVSDGWRVRGIGRTPLNNPEVEFFHAGGLEDRAAIRAAMQGASRVVHLAARVHARLDGAGDPAAECRRVNVDGTAVVLEEAIAAGVNNFVFASSVKAVANESDAILNARTVPHPTDAYGESKLAAEGIVAEAAARAGIAASILRLPNVYGPGMKANMISLFKAVQMGIPLPLGLVRNRRSFVYVDNAVLALRQLLDAGSGTFYVSDEHDLSTPDLVRIIAKSLGRPLRLLPVPQTMLQSLTGAGALLSRIPGFHLKGDSLTAVLGSLFVDTSGLRETTGYAPQTSVERGMLQTAEWFMSRSSAAT